MSGPLSYFNPSSSLRAMMSLTAIVSVLASVVIAEDVASARGTKEPAIADRAIRMVHITEPTVEDRQVGEGGIMRGAAADDDAHGHAPANNTKFLFRGRLIGVRFSRFGTDDTICLTLQFLTEDPIADYSIRPPGTSIQEVATNITLDPSILNAANYRELIEAGIGHDVHLGDSCLVVAHWPGAHGKELLTIEPATPEAEARLRVEHHESVVYFRRLNNKSQSAALLMRLGAHKLYIQQLIVRLEEERNASPEHRNDLIDSIKHAVNGFLADYAMQKELLASRMSELRAAAEIADDELERNTLGLMLGDLKEIDSQVEERRSAIMQCLRDACLEALIPAK